MRTLKQLISKNENSELEILLGEEFTVKLEDVAFAVYLGEKQRKISKNSYDDSVETGVFLSYLYHQLKKEGLSRDFTNQFKGIVKPYSECRIYWTQDTPLSKEEESLPEYALIVERRRKSKLIKEELSKFFEGITKSHEYLKAKETFVKCRDYFGSFRNIDKDTIKKIRKNVVNKDIINIFPTEKGVSFAGKVAHYITHMLIGIGLAFRKDFHSIY